MVVGATKQGDASIPNTSSSPKKIESTDSKDSGSPILLQVERGEFMTPLRDEYQSGEDGEAASVGGLFREDEQVVEDVADDFLDDTEKVICSVFVVSVIVLNAASSFLSHFEWSPENLAAVMAQVSEAGLVSSKIEVLGRAVTRMKPILQALKRDVGFLQGDMDWVKSELQELKQDVERLKLDMASVKSELQDLRNETKGIRETNVQILAELKALRDQSDKNVSNQALLVHIWDAYKKDGNASAREVWFECSENQWDWTNMSKKIGKMISEAEQANDLDKVVELESLITFLMDKFRSH